MKFDYDDIVRVRADAPEQPYRGQRAWVVGIAPEHRRARTFLEQYPTGVVYTIEFEDGSSAELHESSLDLIEHPG